MTLTKIEAEIEIPEGFEFDRIDNNTRKGDYDFDGKAWSWHELEFESPRIILRKKLKPAKPAYRVYRSISSGNTYTRDSNGVERYDHLDGEGIVREWISDWIEYDPPKKWPTPLVERIAAIDIKAAEWIVDHWDDLLDWKYQACVTVGRESQYLYSMFDWKEAPQEPGYWDEISNKLGE